MVNTAVSPRKAEAVPYLSLHDAVSVQLGLRLVSITWEAPDLHMTGDEFCCRSVLSFLFVFRTCRAWMCRVKSFAVFEMCILCS